MQHQRESFLFGIVGLALMLTLSTAASARLPFKPSAAELKALPGFCRGQKSPIPMHYGNHFCYGLKFLNRAYKSLGNKSDREWYLSEAVRHFAEAIDHTLDQKQPAHYAIYLGLLYRYQADAYKWQKKYTKAITGYQTAIKYNPKDTRAYASLSNLYKSRGLKQEAREVLEQGLKVLPNSKLLKKKLARLRK